MTGTKVTPSLPNAIFPFQTCDLWPTAQSE